MLLLSSSSGPDAHGKVSVTVPSRATALEAHLELAGFVLALRGPLTPQPITSSGHTTADGRGQSALLWNGEIFDGVPVRAVVTRGGANVGVSRSVRWETAPTRLAAMRTTACASSRRSRDAKATRQRWC